MKTPWIIANRGASGDAPENTALAFREALRQKTEVVDGIITNYPERLRKLLPKTTRKKRFYSPETHGTLL